MKALSPIEKMIDAACGYNPADPPKLPITLRCLCCGKSQETWRDDSDPPGTVTIESVCPACEKDGRDCGRERDPIYRNKQGEVLEFAIPELKNAPLTERPFR